MTEQSADCAVFMLNYDDDWEQLTIWMSEDEAVKRLQDDDCFGSVKGHKCLFKRIGEAPKSEREKELRLLAELKAKYEGSV